VRVGRRKNGSGDKSAAESKVHCFVLSKTVSFFKILVVVERGQVYLKDEWKSSL